MTASRAQRVNEIVERALKEAESYEGRLRADLARLWREYLRPFRRALAAAVVLTLVLSIQPFAFAFCTRYLADDVLCAETGIDPADLEIHYRSLWLYIAALVIIWILSLVSDWVRTWLIQSSGQKMVYTLRKQLHEKLQALHIGYYERTSTGRIMSRVLGDVRVIHVWVTNRVVTLLTGVVKILIGLGVMFYLDGKLALLALVTLPLYAYSFHRIRPLVKRKSIALRRMQAQLYGRTAERIAGIQVIKAFGREQGETRAFVRRVSEMVRVHMRMVFDQQVLSLCSVVVASVSTAALTYLLMVRVREGSATLGSALAFLQSLAALFGPVNSLTTRLTQIQRVLVVVRRVFHLLDEKVEVVPGRIRLEGLVGKIRFDHVTFTYPGQADPALKDVCFSVEPGEKIALMGPSGAGKSTVFQLLMRFYDPAAGEVRVGGVSLADADPSSVRNHVCMVQQEPIIFSGTIADNILYGRVDATPGMVMKAAQQAELHAFVMELALKYETEVGEQGITLSGGQKQRLALATALLTEPEVLLLDDTTSALDARTEAKIRETLNRVLEGRTSLIITHRVRTARDADRIMVLDGGHIVQEGTHQELFCQEGFYRRVCEQQEAV
jgi:ABC-type multidrug transport system fused ATPase/permease subunit